MLFTPKQPVSINSILLLLAGILLTSCVTINVYFPAAAAEKAADRIIDQVLGEDSQPSQEDSEPPKQEDRQGQGAAVPAVEQFLVGVLNLLIADAQASANIDVSSPVINQLKSAMQARHAQMSPYYKNGAIGYDANGLVAVRDIKQVNLRDRGKVKQLVARENQDRNTLYREIANRNGHPEWEPQIRSTFAKRWIARAPAGWYYRNSSGSWKQK